MMKNITLGQYFPGDSIVHRIDPRTKLIFMVVYIIMLFAARNFVALGICIAFMFSMYFLSKISFLMAWRSVKGIIPIILFTAIINMFFTDGNIIFEFWIFKVTDRGVSTALLMTLRIICLIAGTAILTYTTSPIALTDGIERLFSPFKKLGLPVHEVAMMMTIALRFIPTLIEETDKIMSAQKARGADMESGNLIQRIRALLPILIPLFISAFRRADELALAMESRCYRGGEGRTRMRQLSFSMADVLSSVVVVICLISIFVVNGLFGSILA